MKTGVRTASYSHRINRRLSGIMGWKFGMEKPIHNPLFAVRSLAYSHNLTYAMFWYRKRHTKNLSQNRP